VIVRFVDTGRIVDLHCLNFPFIKTPHSKPNKWATRTPL